MAQNSGYYPPQHQPQQQYTQVFPPSRSQPQNIYQQLGKPQPQPHLQGHPTNEQSSALVVQPQGGSPFSQQLPSQVQTSFPLGDASHALLQTLCQSQTHHVSPQTPYTQVFSQSQPQNIYQQLGKLQPQPHLQGHPTYQHLPSQPPYASVAHSATLAPGSNNPFPRLAIQATMALPSDPPSPKRGRPLPIPTATTGKQTTVNLGIIPRVFSGSLAISAFSTQSSITSQSWPQPQPQPIQVTTTSPNTKSPWPPPVAHSATLAPGSSKPFPRLAIQATVSPPSDPPSPNRGRPLPIPAGTAGKVDLKKNSHGISGSLANSALSTQSSISATTSNSNTSAISATTPNSNTLDITATASNSNTSGKSVLPPPKKSTPIWKHTIPNYPAPAWGYAVGMVSEPHPKPKTQLPTRPAPVKEAPPATDAKGKLKKKQNKTVALPPPPVPAVSSVKGTTQRQQYSPSKYRQLGQQGSTSLIQSGVQRHTYQQQRQQVHSGHARSPTTYSETPEEDEEDEDEEEEDSEGETDSDEEEEDEDEEEERPDPRHNFQNRRQKHIRPMANIASGNGVTTNGRKIRIVPRRRERESLRDEDITQQPRLRIGGQQTHGRKGRRLAGGLICGGCNGSIMGRIVSAMGSRWHPACFRCTVCNELLEHVSSYEHEGQLYCHLDYHENFAPRCYSCKTAIIEEQFISLDDPALGKRTYHPQHFFCAECGDPFLVPSVSFPYFKGEVELSGDGEFEGFTVYKGHPYCETCHVRLRLPKCKRCKRSIRDHDEAVEALGGKWCWGCFVCATCNEPFENPSFFQRDNKPFCEHCFSIMLRSEL